MEKNTSQQIADFLTFLSGVTEDYKHSQEEVRLLEELTQDSMHKLELQDHTYHERAKIASALRQCRIDRRFHKDRITILDPIVQCLTSDKGKLILSQLQQTLGAVRKAERSTQDRRYIPRILSAEEYQGIS